MKNSFCLFKNIQEYRGILSFRRPAVEEKPDFLDKICPPGVDELRTICGQASINVTD
jgi:hypothetical protein